MEKPTFVFIQYLFILRCTAPKAKIRFFDFFDQRSKIIAFEPDIEFKNFIIFRISVLNYPKTRIFCKKKYFDSRLAWWFIWKKCFFLDYHIQKVSQIANIKILRFWKKIQNPLEIYSRLEYFYRNLST